MTLEAFNRGYDLSKVRRAFASELGLLLDQTVSPSTIDAALANTGLVLVPDAHADGTDAYLVDEPDPQP